MRFVTAVCIQEKCFISLFLARREHNSSFMSVLILQLSKAKGCLWIFWFVPVFNDPALILNLW